MIKNSFVLSLSLFLLITNLALGQIVSIEPTGAGADDKATLYFDASLGNAELKDHSKIYMHHGTVVTSPTGKEWSNVVGNWGNDDGVGEMTKVEGEEHLWKYEFTPTIREYFKASDSENIFRISAVFRSADGNTKGTYETGIYSWGEVSDGDFFINLNSSEYVTITAPSKSDSYVNQDETIEISAIATSNASTITLSIDEGEGYTKIASLTSSKGITHSYTPKSTKKIGIKVVAIINGKEYTDETFHQIVLITESEVADVPQGLKQGANYSSDHTKVTLVLQAPSKDFVYVVGDHSNWEIMDEYKMKKAPDGPFFWLEISNLIPQKNYVYQYWIDGDVKVGDPFAVQVADPWNDKYINEEIFPNLPDYSKTEYGIATVFQTDQEEYQWNNNEKNWVRPSDDQLVIYELLIRDFIESHSYNDLIDTIAYLKNLGINAIELMPVNEFEGNESWGYNPNYYFAVDKYYGTPNALKQFIDVAHQNGMAVITDLVLNHSFGSSPMVQMYWDASKSQPATNNPWYNAEYVGTYQWGYDFNHESQYTKDFIDRVNKYWLEDFHFDGIRFDFTKGFTNYAPGGNTDGYDQSRINILKRMANEIWNIDSTAYVILEHWGNGSEEKVLGDYGMKLWKRNDHDFRNAVNGENSGSFSASSSPDHVVYFDSHDENRIANEALSYGGSKGAYNVKDPQIMYERMKMAAAFQFLQPGPKMMWMFDELGYDIHIDYNGRVGNKPLPWGNNGLGYYEEQNRKYIYDAYSAILQIRETVDPAKLATAETSHQQSGTTRRLSYDTDNIDLVVIANFDLEDHVINPAFTESGTWYNYFSGEEINVTDIYGEINLKPGEWHIFTNQKLTNGLANVVETFDTPVTVEPSEFTLDDEITITFDASKAWADGTNGLIDASEVYLYSGLVINDQSATEFDKTVDGEAGKMTSIGNNQWQITLTPGKYFDSEAAFKMGMYFTDADGKNLGKGFRNSTIFYDITATSMNVSISPSSFNIDDEITVTFFANQGNQELMNADKIYMHSSVGIEESDDPWMNAWNKAVGNWGADDGIGEMTKIEENTWEITLVPQNYFELNEGENIYWFACVFRSADGNTKGTMSEGEYKNGVISSNLDYFIKNQQYREDTVTTGGIFIYPNPAQDKLYISRINQEALFQLYNFTGKQFLSTKIDNNGLEISDIPHGIYIYRIELNEKQYGGRIVVN